MSRQSDRETKEFLERIQERSQLSRGEINDRSFIELHFKKMLKTILPGPIHARNCAKPFFDGVEAGIKGHRYGENCPYDCRTTVETQKHRAFYIGVDAGEAITRAKSGNERLKEMQAHIQSLLAGQTSS